MKKFLAFFLAALMVASCMTFTVSAEESKVSGMTFVPLSTADAIQSASGIWKQGNTAATYSILADNKTQGEGAFAITVEGKQSADTVGAFEFAYTSNSALDVSGMNTLVFDLYVSDAGAIAGLTWDLMLYDATNGAYNDNYRSWYKGYTLGMLSNKTIETGWNRIEIDLTSMTKGYTDFADLSAFKMFRMYCNENDRVEHGVENGELTLAIDNVYFKADKVAEPAFRLPLLAAGTNNQNSDTISTPHNNNTPAAAWNNPTAGFRASTKMWGGGGFTVDLTQYAALEFDVYIDNAFANKVHYTLNFGCVTDYYQANSYMYSKTLEELAGYELQVGWNHVKIDLSRFDVQQYENSSKRIDWTSVNYFSMHNDASKAVGTVDTSDTMVTIKVQGACLTKGGDYITISNFHPIRSNENYGYPSHTQKANWPSDTAKLKDIDGDGDTELVLTEATGAGTTKFTSTNSGFTHMNTTCYALNLHSVPTDFSNVTGFSIDIYAAFGDEDTQDVTNLTGEIRLNNNVNFDFNNRDAYFSFAMSLKEATPLGNNWYRVTVPMEKVTKHTGVEQNGKPGGGEPDLNEVNVLRFVGMSAIDYTDGFVCAADNLRFMTCEMEVEQEEETKVKLLHDFTGGGAIPTVKLMGEESWLTTSMNTGIYAGLPSKNVNGAWNVVSYADAGKIDAENGFSKIIRDFANTGFDSANDGAVIATHPAWLANENVRAFQFDVCVEADGMKTFNDRPMDPADMSMRLALFTYYDDVWNGPTAFFKPSDGVALGDGWYRVTLPLYEFYNYAYLLYDTGYDLSYLWGARVDSALSENYGITYDGNFNVYVDNLSVVLKDDYVENAPAPIYPSYSKINSAKLVLAENFGLDFSATVQNLNDVVASFDYLGNMVYATGVAGANGTYTFSFDGILAHQLGDTLTATLWALDDNGCLVASVIENYSVASYCYRMLEKYPDSTALTKLLNAVLNYGAAAQTYAGYNTDALVNAAAPGYNAQHISRHTAKMLLPETVVGVATDDKVWKSASLLLDSSMIIRYYFEADSVEGLTVNVAKNGSRVDTVTEFGYSDEKAMYYVDVPVNAGEYNATVTVDFGGSYAVNYSVNHYLAKNFGTTGDATFDALLNAIFCYGYQARIYTGNSGV